MRVVEAFMRDDELRRLLAEANPWWAAAAAGGDPTNWREANRALRDRRHYDLGYRSTILEDVAQEEVDGSLVLLMGPRRAGKTVALLDAALSLCGRRDIDSRQVIHVPCDGMTVRELRRVLTMARTLTRSLDNNVARRRVWLFDEVSGIPGWTAAFKAARDSTAFGDDTVVATGSRWVSHEDLQAHLLAGRAGSGERRRIRQLLPMGFREVLRCTRADLALPERRHPTRLREASVAEDLQKLAFGVDAYDLAWQDYLCSGGFPRAVAEFHRTGAVSTAYQRDLLAWLRADVDPDAPLESVPLLLSTLMERMTSPLDIQKTAAAAGYSSREAFSLRLQRLVNSQALLRCPRRLDGGQAMARTQAKHYLVDPLLAWLPGALRSGLPAPTMPALSEMALAVTVARAVDGLEEGRWLADDTIGYARTDSGREIDFSPVPVLTEGGTAFTTPLESKWVDRGWRQEALVLEGRYGQGVMATKSILDVDHACWAVPAPLVACLLG
jgi:predicted AAA+ superfamily ATPase